MSQLRGRPARPAILLARMDDAPLIVIVHSWQTLLRPTAIVAGGTSRPAIHCRPGFVLAQRAGYANGCEAQTCDQYVHLFGPWERVSFSRRPGSCPGGPSPRLWLRECRQPTRGTRICPVSTCTTRTQIGR